MNTENNSKEIPTDERPKRGRGSKRPHGGPKGLRSSKGGRRPDGKSRRGRRRPLAHGDLRLLILNIIGTTPSHGYGLISKIKNLTSGIYEPSPGVIYPALEALQDLGWVEVQPDKGKRVLHITKDGETELAAQSQAIIVIEERLKTLTSPDQTTEPVDIRSALRQLKYTTVLAVKDQSNDAEIRKTVIAILAEAQQKIVGLK